MTTKPIPDALDPIEQLKRISPEKIQADIIQAERHLALLRHLTKALASFADPGEGAKAQPAAKRGNRASRGLLLEPVTLCLRNAKAPMPYSEVARAIGAKPGAVFGTLTRNQNLFFKTKEKTWRLK